MSEFTHRPVLLDECIEGLNIKPDGIYVDGTLGRAGHSREIARRLTTGRLVCIDRDQAALDIHHKTPMMAQIASLREKYGLRMRVERYVDAPKANK